MASTFDQSSRKSGCESSDVLAGWALGWVVRVGPHTNVPQGIVCTDTLPPGCGPQTHPAPVGRTLRGAPVFPTSAFPAHAPLRSPGGLLFTFPPLLPHCPPLAMSRPNDLHLWCILLSAQGL